MTKPPVFKLYDALTFGLAAVIVTVLVAIAQFNGLNDHVATWRWIGMWLIAAGFWAGYGLVLWWRWGLRRRVLYSTVHGLMVIDDGGVVPSKTELTSETQRVIDAWASVPDTLPMTALERGLLVFVKPLPFELDGKPGRFAGFMRLTGDAIAVGMDGRPLEHTALGHELGHVILKRSGQRADEQALKAAADEHGVPY